MIRTDLQEEIFRMRFEEAYDHYQDKRLSQGEAARLPGRYWDRMVTLDDATRSPARGLDGSAARWRFRGRGEGCR